MANSLQISELAQIEWEKKLWASLNNATDLQTWEGHLDTRFPELHQIKNFFPQLKKSHMLELGCGNALGSVFYSNRFEKITATDLAQEDHSKHAIGFNKARMLIRSAAVSNVELLGCSAESLPFPNESMDVVLGLYCLEHIPNKELALRETMRVLKKGGVAIFAVPGAAWSIIYPLAFYHEMGLRIIQRVFAKCKTLFLRSGPPNGEAKSSIVKEIPSATVVNDWKSFHKIYPHFPIPKPHGEYISYFHELFFHRRSSWERAFLNAGFSSVNTDALSMIPRGLFNIFFGKKIGAFLFRYVLRFDLFLSKISFWKSGAQFFCITARKG